MQNCIRFILCCFMCLVSSALKAQNPPFEIDSLWIEKPYQLWVTTYYESGVYPPKITIEVVNTATEEVVYFEEGEQFQTGFVFGKSIVELGGFPTALLEFRKEATSLDPTTTLLALVLKGNQVKRETLTTYGYFEAINLDKDAANELLISEHLFHRLNVRGCNNKTMPSPYVNGRLLPKIYEWQGDSLFQVVGEREQFPYFTTYIDTLQTRFSADTERFISHYKNYSKPNIPTLLDYTQYFYLCYFVGKKRKHPLIFFQEKNKLFMYICKDVPGRSFTIDTSLSRFFEEFGRTILTNEDIANRR